MELPAAYKPLKQLAQNEQLVRVPARDRAGLDSIFATTEALRILQSYGIGAIGIRPNVKRIYERGGLLDLSEYPVMVNLQQLSAAIPNPDLLDTIMFAVQNAPLGTRGKAAFERTESLLR